MAHSAVSDTRSSTSTFVLHNYDLSWAILWCKNAQKKMPESQSRRGKAKGGRDSTIFIQWVKAQDRRMRAGGEAAERASCIWSLQSSRASVTHCSVSALNFL